MKKFLLTLISILSINSYVLLAQIDPIPCETTTGSGPESTTWGLYKPAQTGSGEYFRVLIAYAQFASDADTNSVWPLNQLPTWKNDLIDTAVTGTYRDQTLSDYFDVASNNKFNFIGDVYQDTIIIPTDMAYGTANKYVIDELNANISDFSRYDNWKLVSGNHVFSEGSGDGYLDMLIIVYRSANHFPNWGGIANLNIAPQDTTHDGIIINGSTSATGSGITTKVGLSGKFAVVGHLAHEFGHYLFGGGHLNFGGLMVGAPHPGATATGTYMMNAWERNWLGYITPTVPTTDGEQIVLGDFVTSNAAIKIPIPFNDSTSSTFLIVENHQRVHKYDQIMRGESLNGNWNLTTTLGQGLYIWVITNGNSWYPTIDIKSADGAWDWTYEEDYHAGPGWYNEEDDWYEYVPATYRSAVDRNEGQSDRHPDHIWWNNHSAQKWVDINPATGNYELTRDVMGEANDAFNEDYNELFTPWSNPSSYVNDTTNISVELVSKSGNNITVKVYSTYNSAKALPPSKPQNLKVVSQSNHPYLTWEANIEPDISAYYIYRRLNGGNWQNIANTTQTYYQDNEVNVNSPIDNFDYRIKAYDTQAKYSVESEKVSIKGFLRKINNEEQSSLNEFKLFNNYPNPFNPTTIISYNLPKNGFVTLKVYDVLGKEIANLVNENKEAGYHSVEYNASHLPSGVYFYKITAGNFSEIRKMLLLK